MDAIMDRNSKNTNELYVCFEKLLYINNPVNHGESLQTVDIVRYFMF